MRRFAICLVAVGMAYGAAVVAQKANTPDDLDKAMKRLQPANVAVNKAIQSMAYADAKKALDTVEDALEDAHNFWVVKKKADAIKMSKDALAKADALEKALSASKPDTAAVTAAMKEFGATCRDCHTAYREQDANQQFVLKTGSVQ